VAFGNADALNFTSWPHPTNLARPPVAREVLLCATRDAGQEDAIMLRYTVVLAMLGGIGVGAVAVQGLHAQVKTPYYMVTEIDVRDPDPYNREYVPKIVDSLKKWGGRYVVIGAPDPGARDVISFNGTPPKRVTIVVWDSLDAMFKWSRSAEFKDARRIGERYASFRQYAVEAYQ
jgi:uncharacterized protein (DUF1330 family)